MPGTGRPRIRGSLVAVLAAGAVLALLCANLLALAELGAARDQARRSRRVEDALSRLRLALTDAETGERGYLLTGQASYLEPFDRAARRLPEVLAVAKDLAAGNSEQQRRIRDLEGLAVQKFHELSETIELRRSGKDAQALAVVETGRGESAMDGVRRQIADVSAAEDRLRTADSARTARYLTTAIVIDGLAGLGLVLLGILLFRVHHDISRRELLEQALRQAAAFQQGLVGIVSHDLRNPLNSISMAAGMLQKRGLDDEQRKIASLVASSAARMGRMVEQLLDLTRAQLGGGIPLDPQPDTDLGAVVAHAAAELRMAHPGLEIRESKEGDGRGEWDSDRLSQVASNLLGNAAKHGGSPVEVGVRGWESEVVLEVHNGGEPIPADVLPVIFDPFRRGREAPSGIGSADGLGLGLFICRAVIDAHGGKLEVRSTEAEGTIFRAILPRKRATSGPRT
ncbi:MAG: sensor histidine kinase [Myxococcales bacterium]